MEYPLKEFVSLRRKPTDAEISLLSNWFDIGQWKTDDACHLLAGAIPVNKEQYPRYELIYINPSKKESLNRDIFLALDNYILELQYLWDESNAANVGNYRDWITWASQNNIFIPWLDWSVSVGIFVEEANLGNSRINKFVGMINAEIEKHGGLKNAQAFHHPYNYHDLKFKLSLDSWTASYGLLMLAEIVPDNKVYDVEKCEIVSLEDFTPLDRINFNEREPDDLVRDINKTQKTIRDVKRQSNSNLDLKKLQKSLRELKETASSIEVKDQFNAKNDYRKCLIRLTQLWDSAEFDDKRYPIEHFIEWGASKGVNPNWVDWARSNNLLPSRIESDEITENLVPNMQPPKLNKQQQRERVLDQELKERGITGGIIEESRAEFWEILKKRAPSLFATARHSMIGFYKNYNKLKSDDEKLDFRKYR